MGCAIASGAWLSDRIFIVDNQGVIRYKNILGRGRPLVTNDALGRKSRRSSNERRRVAYSRV
jgi:hypothetical protein